MFVKSIFLSFIFISFSSFCFAGIDEEADNIASVPIEKKIELRRSADRRINYATTNYSNGRLRDIIKATNDANRRAAILQQQEVPEDIEIDVNDRNVVKVFMRQEIITEPETLNQ